MKHVEISTRAGSALCLLATVAGCASPGASGSGAKVVSSEATAPAEVATESLGQASPDAELSVYSSHLMPIGLTTIGATTLGDHLYVLGGYFGKPHAYSGRDQSRQFHRLDLKTQRWEELPSVGPVQSAILVNDGRYVYRIGGMVAKNAPGEPENMQSQADVGRFDPRDNSWTALPSLPEPRSSHHAVMYGTKLIVIGGWRLAGGTYDNQWHASLAICDVAEPQCSWKIEPMPFETRAHGAAVLDDRLYVLGGLGAVDGKDDVHVYDLKAGTWSKGPALPKGNTTIAGAVHRGRLYANGADGKVYRLSADGAAWQVAGELTFPRMFHQLIEGPDGLLAVGGIPSVHRGKRIRHIEQLSLEPAPAGVVWTLDAESAAKNRQGAFLLGSQLYVFGGNNSLAQHDFEPKNFVSSAHRLDLGTLEWQKISDFPAQRQSMQALVGGTKDKPLGIAIGGFGFAGDQLGSQPEVFGYDVKADQWSGPLAKMPVSRSQFGLAEWEGDAWVIGGLNFEAGRRGDEFELPVAVLRLDLDHPEAGFADAGFAIGKARRAFAGGLLGDRFYMTGGLESGFEPVRGCEALDLRTRQPVAMTCPSSHRLGGQLVPVGDRLYLVGGSAVPDAGGDRVPSTRIEAYDPEADSWTTVSETLPFDEPKQLTAFEHRGRLLLYTANRSSPTAQVALLDPAAFAAGQGRFVSVPVPAAK